MDLEGCAKNYIGRINEIHPSAAKEATQIVSFTAQLKPCPFENPDVFLNLLRVDFITEAL